MCALVKTTNFEFHFENCSSVSSNRRPAASTPPDLSCHFLMLSISTPSRAVKSSDTLRAEQHCGDIWHVESCRLNHFQPCMLLWALPTGLSMITSVCSPPARCRESSWRKGGAVEVCSSSVSISSPSSSCRLSRPALHLAPLGLR